MGCALPAIMRLIIETMPTNGLTTMGPIWLKFIVAAYAWEFRNRFICFYCSTKMASVRADEIWIHLKSTTTTLAVLGKHLVESVFEACCVTAVIYFWVWWRKNHI